jgi:hypothetical protein
MFQPEHLEQFCRNAVDISANSEDNLKAMVGRLEMAERDRPQLRRGKWQKRQSGTKGDESQVSRMALGCGEC